MRAGAYGLSLLSDPLDVQVLRALEAGPVPLIDLRRAVGSPPQTTLRKHLRALTEIGVLARQQQREFPAAVWYELTPSGAELLGTAGTLSTWLATAPDGQRHLGGSAAKSAIKSLVDAWTTRIIRALAARPLSLTELDRLLSGVNYPALERRLAAMRLSGQVVPAPGRAGSTPYKASRWLREAIAPLIAAANWERRYTPNGREPLGRLDVEAIFLLAAPLLELPAGADGSCRLVVDVSNGRQRTLAGAVVAVERGRPASWTSDLRADVAATVAGSAAAWLEALGGGEQSGIEFGGDAELAEALIAALRRLAQPRSDSPLSLA